ncbi:amidohydrolase family protein [Sphingobium sp. EM0848]|uniref:N-acyl-D-amino-acid deacylase family protein n=1 Tax=Sphingobium sp. EM0848 TaxID=2743473 RepID=UPI00159C495F|nr:amidohydrolase family protein [Sphingobium sp. EM0848]
MVEYDVIIRGGLIVDGSGGAPFTGDVAIRNGLIATIGMVEGKGAREIDASGKLVTPGFVDIHTHYDGQVTWEHRLMPSSNHGTTTVVTGNCGVGFAPCRPDDRLKLVKVMEGVEDIPEIVMTEGIPWNWESFPEYMDALAARSFDVDVAVQIPHSPLRVYVMGDRGVNHDASSEADRAEMTRLVAEAVRRGAVGVSTSRSLNHRAKDGKPAPSVQTAVDEVLALAQGLAEAGAGVFQIITEMSEPPEQEMAIIQRIGEVSRRPVSFTLSQVPEAPDSWRGLIAGMEKANAAGCTVRGQIHERPVGVLLGLELSLNPLSTKPSYKAIARLPLAERIAIMRDPAFKAKLLAEDVEPDPVPLANRLIGAVDRMFALGADPDYAPPREMQIGARAEARGVSPLSLAYDLLLEQDGHAILCLPSANFVSGTLKEVREMMQHPDTVIALGDGGAHYGVICDAGYPTHLLTHWGRDVAEEERFPIEWMIAALTRRPAETVGLMDRGLLAPGMKADINVIDHQRLRLHSPRPVYNLPAGGRRLQQRADGYEVTLVNGVITYREGEPTGALPGRLVRGSGFQEPLRDAA